MSLNDEERHRTSSELHANLGLSGLTVGDIAVRLDLDLDEVEQTLGLAAGCRPELVWLLRDHLEAAVRTAGGQPHPYTYLSEGMRAAAAGWFPLRDAP